MSNFSKIIFSFSYLRRQRKYESDLRSLTIQKNQAKEKTQFCKQMLTNLRFLQVLKIKSNG